MSTGIIHYTNCPACNSSSVSKVLELTDHSVSKEAFEIWECATCSLRFTQDVPDAANIGRYYKSPDYISHSNTRTGIVNKLYHTVRHYTLSQKRKLIRQRTGLPTGALLDIGAGAGTFAAHMQEAGWKVTGLEPDPTTRETAFRDYKIRLEASEKLYDLTPQSYNAITMWHVLEHVHDLHGYLSQIAKLMKPGAVLFIAVPNYTSDDADRYGEEWAAYDVPIHLYHFSPRSMQKLLAKHGFKLRATKPMWFDSFYVSLLSEKYKTGKQHLLKGFSSGLISNFKALSNRKRCSSLIYIAEL